VAAGKKIKCPKCGSGFRVPGEDDTPAPAKAVAVRPRKVVPAADDDDDRDEERSERRRARKPRRKPKKVAGNAALVWGVVIGGAVLLIGVAVTLGVAFWLAKKKTEPIADNSPSAAAAADPGPSRGPAPGPGADEPGPSKTEPDAFAAGRKVFVAHNCTRCHSAGASPPGGGGQGRTRGPNLSRVGADPSHTVEWLKEYVRNPKSKKADAKMPPFEGKISQDDLQALAEYLASLK